MFVSGARKFSAGGKYFAFINGQGKFIIYETETSNVAQVYTPNLHLNVPCTCFTWLEIGAAPSQSAKKKKKRVSSQSEPQTFVAFGTSKGGVALYSLALAKIEKVLKGAGHSGPIVAISADLYGDSLYTAGADGKVIEWSLSECEQKSVHNLGVEKLSCLAIAEQGKLVLSGSKQLKVWNTTEGRVVKTLVGHTSNTILVENLIGPDENVYVLTGSINDRNVSLWSLVGDGRTAVGLFALDDAPEYFSTRIIGSKLHLVAVSRTGVAHYYIKDLNKINASKPVKANHTYEVALDATAASSKAVDRLPIFTASIEFSSNQDHLLVAYGTDLSLKFEQVTIDKSLKHNVIIRTQPASINRKGQDDKELKAKTPFVDNASAEFLNPVNAGKKSLKTVEIPMEARLENLALSADGDTSRTSQKNMAHLLIQGLHSKDAAILRSVFSRNEPELIQRTAERIPAQYISVLLDEISSLMQKKTVHVATAVSWLKAIIHSHASQLMALGADHLLSNLGTCLGILEYRVEHANSLSKLSGRLELLVGQIDRTERLAKNPDAIANNSHVLVHQEDDDSEVDSVIGKERDSNESSEDDFNGMIDDADDDDQEEDEAAGSFVRLRNGNIGQENGSTASDDDDDEEEDEDEEMSVSD
ncbi:WD repeat-containing protein 43 [Toxorhynchites rutilus septentrionalis]|uniref:WD repeat-containing protein 43 n=1 Tax=Toxorhynchites rutilus septentrionalis TaxID=329112 RepID=UPI002479BB59|nr:WD repeat-containing protein 43 [Toxorhynchites rutilus septentrionalis]